ncbi:MAG: hypothetical protein SF069_01405 [Phycisphaerae bacterium]|nr:hypothetical protein [Phycisphaerae bacterium]
MANRRNRPTLYEVVSRNRRERQAARPPVPVSPPTVSEPPATTTGTHAAEAARAAAIRAAAASVASGRATAVERTHHIEEPAFVAGQPILTLNDARVQLSLSAQQAVLLALGLAAMLIVAFFSGRQSVGQEDARDLSALAIGPTAAPVEAGGQPTPTEPRPAPRGDSPTVRTARPADPVEDQPLRTRPDPAPVAAPPANPRVAEQSEPPPSAPPAAPVVKATEFSPEVGKFYVIAQHFPKDKRADAERALAFLVGKGVPAVLLTSKESKEYRLACTTPFDTAKATESLIAEVKRHGTAYVENGYNFGGCYSNVLRKK